MIIEWSRNISLYLSQLYFVLRFEYVSFFVFQNTFPFHQYSSTGSLYNQFCRLRWPASQNSCCSVLTGLLKTLMPLTRVLRKHDIKVFNKLVRTPLQEFPSPKDRPKIEKHTNVVYKVGCKDCPWRYISETGRCFETRKKEHIRNVKQNTAGSNIAKHSWTIQ